MNTSKSKMKKIIHLLKLTFRAIRIIRNWPTYFMDYFGLIHKSYLTLALKNGVKYYIRGNSTDRGIVTSVWLEDEYLASKEGIKDGSTIVDIGAQIGIFSVMAASLAKNVKVYSFEPTPDNFKFLSKNITLNNFSDRIKAFNLAVAGESDKTVKIFLSENTGGHSMIQKVSNKFILSKTTTLKKVFEDNKIMRCFLLKMDCEGSEYDIIYNTPDDIFKRINKIYLEYHDQPDNAKHRGLALQEFLKDKGFKVTNTGPLEPFLYARKE